jgi:hypothetical protein
MNTAAANAPWLAQRVRGAGVVPTGCTGLKLVGSQIEQFASGQAAGVRPEGRLWWISHAPLTFSLAPEPAAPDAGVRLDLAPWQPGGLLFADALANWLNSIDADEVGVPHLTDTLRYTAPAALALPPCAQSGDLDSARQALNGALKHAIGVSCDALFRVDLAAEAVACEEPAMGVPPMRTPDSDEASLDGYVREFARNEAYAERRFFIELPALRDAINRCEVADEALGERFFELRYRAQRLVSTRSGRRPQVAGQHPKRQPSPAVIRLMALVSRRATSGLDAAWAALAMAGRPDGVLSAAHVPHLESALTEIEIQLNRRFTPWWEIAA